MHMEALMWRERGGVQREGAICVKREKERGEIESERDQMFRKV